MAFESNCNRCGRALRGLVQACYECEPIPDTCVMTAQPGLHGQNPGSVIFHIWGPAGEGYMAMDAQVVLDQLIPHLEEKAGMALARKP